MYIATVLTAALFLSACSNLSPAAADGKPQLAERYQKGFDRAWSAAGEGNAPTIACATVIGGAVGTMQTAAPGTPAHAEATAAANACYVDVMVRYISHKLDGPEFADSDCAGLIAVTTIHRNALGGFITDIGQDRAEYDARIVSAVGERVRAACPGMATAILGAA